MTDITLRREDAPSADLAGLVALLREAFAATPLGLVLAAFSRS